MKRSRNIVSDNQQASDAKQIVAHLPDEVKIVERTGNAMMATGQQIILATEQIMKEAFNLSENDLKEYEYRLKHMLTTLADLQRTGLTVLSPKDMEVVGELAEQHLQRERAAQEGLFLPEKRAKDSILAAGIKKK